MWDDEGEEIFDHLNDVLGPDAPGYEEFLRDHTDILHMRRPPISADVFRAEHVLDSLEEENEEAAWGQAPPEWPEGEMRNLEEMLADALYRWIDKNGLWSEFRALQEH